MVSANDATVALNNSAAGFSNPDTTIYQRATFVAGLLSNLSYFTANDATEILNYIATNNDVYFEDTFYSQYIN